ncbi:hypothetical protein V5740_02455 [Croceibacterium sp. TMG7-5b_MA50]|uniref:hypothetical protein n=1 Tax=Croceibacterium sp. TMG7-5b_MA50 TaxID=3121290 RepID=UPI00322157A4
MHRLSTLGLFLAILSQPAAAQQQTEAEQREQWSAAQARQRAFVRELFDRAGFAPVAELSAEGREVRRMLLRDPYGGLPVPGVELERRASGEVTLRLQYRNWSTDPVQVAASAWQELAALEDAVLTQADFVPLPPSPPSSSSPPLPPPICHGWNARFEADYHRNASWSQCGGDRGPALDYAVAFAEIAVSSKAGCAFDRGDPFGSYNKCWGETLQLDDRALDRDFAALRAEYDAAHGHEQLGKARVALRVEGMEVGDPQWVAARDAVAEVKAVRDVRWDCLRRLQQLAGRASDASPADRAKMRQTVDHWSRWLTEQERNYAEVLQGLAWPG